MVTDKKTLDQLIRLYVMGKSKDAYLLMAKRAELTPFIVIGTESWRDIGEWLAEGAIDAFITKSPPKEAIMKSARDLIQNQAEKLKDPQFALMLWALMEYYGEIKPNLDYPYGDRGIRVENRHGKTVVSLNRAGDSVYAIYNRYIEGYLGNSVYLEALEELDLALEPGFLAVMTETLNTLASGTMNALTNRGVAITKSKIEKDFQEIYKALKAFNIRLVLDPEKVIDVEGPDEVEFVRKLNDFVNGMVNYNQNIKEKKEKLETEFDNRAMHASLHRSTIDDYIRLHFDEHFVRIWELDAPVHLEGKWYLTNTDENTRNIIRIHAFDPQTKEITGFLEGTYANYELSGTLEGDVVKLKAILATYEDAYNVIANHPEIPKDKVEILAGQFFDLREKIYKTLEFRYINEGRKPVPAIATSWNVQYNTETFQIAKIDPNITMSTKFTVHKEHPKPATVMARPVLFPVYVDGKPIVFEAYNIDGYHYFKLRDLAMAVDGSAKNFDVIWDEENRAILLYANSRYARLSRFAAVQPRSRAGPPLAWIRRWRAEVFQRMWSARRRGAAPFKRAPILLE
jgi:hypothetical protein